MGKPLDVGVYQKENGAWEYRFTIMVDGKAISKKKCTDEYGNKFKTKKQAVKAREIAMEEARHERERQRKIARRTVKEVYDEYCESGRKQRFIDDLDGKKISSLELVNCLPNGTIQTVNSFKYPSREIKAKLGINFKYHYLRHTFGTMLAEMNTPVHLLCNQMGHGNIHVSQRYYLAISKSGVETLRDNLNKL